MDHYRDGLRSYHRLDSVGQAMNMGDEIQYLRAENERLRADKDVWGEAHEVACRRAEQAEARVAALEAALQNYGHHTMRCSAWGPGPAHRPCTCGLDAALARPTPTPGEGAGR